MGIPGLPLGSPGTKCDLDVAPMEKCKEPQRRGGGGSSPLPWRNAENTIKGKVVASPKIGVW